MADPLLTMRPRLEAAIDRAYEAVALISFDGMQFRRDLGRKALVLSQEVRRSGAI